MAYIPVVEPDVNRERLSVGEHSQATRRASRQCRGSRPPRGILAQFVLCSCRADAESEVSELDVAKEQIAYLKFWLGVMVVTDISLFGWLISNATSTTLQLLVGGCLAVIAITAGIALLHRRIERQIQALRGL